MMQRVWVEGSFDELQSRHGSRAVRFLQEAAQLGPLHAVVWPDAAAESRTGQPPRYALAERVYFLQALRYAAAVSTAESLTSPENPPQPGETWAIQPQDETRETRAAAERLGLKIRVIGEEDLQGFPAPAAQPSAEPGRKSVVVTGTFDWLHSGHVRFFEEVAGYGDLTVIVGHDANIRLLKGPGHPLFGQAERLYRVQSIRYVQQAMLSTGSGWLDAEPELERLKPDLYAVNEDGDKPEKRAYCEAHGMEYLVLRRAPKAGLPPRSSTHLRGF